MIKMGLSPREYTEQQIAARKREQAMARRRDNRERANSFVRLNAIPDRLKDSIDTRHVALAAHELIAENYTLRPGPVFERAERLARRETPRALDAWKQLREDLRNRLLDTAFNMWIGPLGFPSEEEDCVLIIRGPIAIVSHFKRRYLPLAQDLLAERGEFTMLDVEAYD